MPTNIATAKRMLTYAATHHLAVPPVSTVNPAWGKGKRLLAWRVSGHADPRRQSDQKTTFLVDLLFPPSLASKACDVALRELGTVEHPAGSNSGTRVQTYQQVTGAFKAPWCASFQCWCFKTAAASLGLKVQFPPLPAYVPSWTAMIRAGQRGWRRVEAIEARRGDVVTLWGSQHIEMVEERDGRTLHCVGGNTAAAGQVSNGGGVFRTVRDVGEVTVAGRPT